jgi:hypothetical protein
LHLDYLGDVTALVEQPFVLHHGKRSHIPDFVFQNDSGITLVNVKPTAFIDDEDSLWTFSVAQAAAQQLGWQYKTFSELDPQYLDNLHWLFGFKDTPFDLEIIQSDVLDCLEQPSTLSKVLSQLPNPFLVKPVVFHLLWHRIIHTDLQQRFSLQMPLWRALEAT